MKQLTFVELAEKVVCEQQKPMTSDEIWKTAVEKGYDKLLLTKGKTPWATLGARLFVMVRDDKNSPFVKIGARPARFALKGQTKITDPENLAKTEIIQPTSQKESGYDEKDLHPFLAYYAQNFLGAHTKTINHQKSEKKAFGEWIHPDMVGCYFPLKEWKPEVFDLSQTIGGVPLKLFSFELKKKLGFSNLREAFFQTVSNSSWANDGYLVAAEISSDTEFLEELRRLSSSFGIGVIHLDISDPGASRVLFQPRTREMVDWETVNKLATMNKEVREFLTRVKNDFVNKEIIKEKYDAVLEIESLVKTIKGQ
jgi:hypothetical protein